MQFEEIAAAIRHQRKALDLTQQQLADLAGCSRLLVQQVERGKAAVRSDKLLAILDALGLKIRLENQA